MTECFIHFPVPAVRLQARTLQHFFGLRRRSKAGQLQNRLTHSITSLSAEPKKKPIQDEQLNTTNVIFIAVSCICFLILGVCFCLFTLCGLLFIAFCSSCFVCMCRIFASETLVGELRRMTWTLGIMTLFGRYLALLYLAHSLIYSGLFIFCFLFQPPVQFLLFSAAFISINYPHIPLLQKWRISLIANGKLNYRNSDYKGFIILRHPEWYLETQDLNTENSEFKCSV
jgi:hypothetical protein